MAEITDIQLKLSDEQLAVADEFVNDCESKSDEEIRMVIAGMTAIIEGNEASYEKIKNQKWFERIWYGLIGKNKATVKEMQANRDKLTNYTIQILVKMNDIMSEHSECILDLYRAIAVVRRDLNIVVGEVNLLVHKLNEKIDSVDNYNFLLNEIRNNKFDGDSPLISLIDIMSGIDSRTAKDTKKLGQLKETMEHVGFEFNREMDIKTYSDEILALPEDRFVRIMLFCKSFSHRSRFLTYTCTLMENYFYSFDYGKTNVQKRDKVINDALAYANLNRDAHYKTGEIFDDLKGAILTPANYCSIKTSNSLNIIVSGMTGSGKSTLVNAIFGWNIVTTESENEKPETGYRNNSDNIIIYDTLLSDVDMRYMPGNSKPDAIWCCINSMSGRCDEDMLVKLKSLGIPMVIVLTNSIEYDDKLESEIIKVNDSIPVVPVLAKEYRIKGHVILPFGLEELIDRTIEIVNVK